MQYAFTAEAEGELSVAVGDTLYVEGIMDGWYQVRLVPHLAVQQDMCDCSDYWAAHHDIAGRNTMMPSA